MFVCLHVALFLLLVQSVLTVSAVAEVIVHKCSLSTETHRTHAGHTHTQTRGTAVRHMLATVQVGMRAGEGCQTAILREPSHVTPGTEASFWVGLVVSVLGRAGLLTGGSWEGATGP